MKSCFICPMKITQKFGNKLFVKDNKIVNADISGSINYYGQYGLAGHSGIDVIPISNDYRIYNFFEGKIVLIEKHPAYGNRIAIHEKKKNIVEFHNHLELINSTLKVGQEISARNYIGIMGATGNCFGAHNHIAICKVNEKCFKDGIIIDRLYRNNGFNGWLSPLFYIGD